MSKMRTKRPGAASCRHSWRSWLLVCCAFAAATFSPSQQLPGTAVDEPRLAGPAQAVDLATAAGGDLEPRSGRTSPAVGAAGPDYDPAGDPYETAAESRLLWRRQVLLGPLDELEARDDEARLESLVAPAAYLGASYDSYREPESLAGRPHSSLQQQEQQPPPTTTTSLLHTNEVGGKKGSPMPATKMGPQFSKEPPGFIHYLNSSDLVIPCAASGNPQPAITWWHRGAQVDSGSLLERRYVRYDNSLVISAFKASDFEPDIHSTTYKCQASNALGSIVSRDVVINAVIDQDYGVSVADQFVTADNDALFRCQLAPQTRDLFQVIGWLEDGQQLAQQQQQIPGSSFQSAIGQLQQPPLALPLLALQTQTQTQSQQQQQQQQTQSHSQRPPGAVQAQRSQAFLLSDGQLYLHRVQLRDTNKSYRCQLKNLLTSQVSLSPFSGRLFVTDASEQAGTAPRIIEGPKAISVARLNEQLLLTCLAQGSPRPNIRWFRLQQQASGQQQLEAKWIELPGSGSGASSNNESSARYVMSAEANLLLIKSLHSADHRARFKCLANNTFGSHQAETELRLELWQPSKLVEVEPKLEYINGSSLLHLEQQQQSAGRRSAGAPALQLNCTVRASSQWPVVAIEWLKNGRHLFALALGQFAPSANGPLQEPMFVTNGLLGGQLANNSLAQASLFDDASQELSALEFYLATATDDEQQPFHSAAQSSPSDLPSSLGLVHSRDFRGASNLAGQQVVTNFMVTTSSLAKLSQEQPEMDQLLLEQTNNNVPPGQSGGASLLAPSRGRLRQKARLINRDTLLYQLQFQQIKRSDRGTYQCRARSLRNTLHAGSQLMLKDNPPQFVETFAGQLIGNGQRATQGGQVSLKCVASGSPLPEVSWSLSGFAVPESSRFRVGDYVTRDGLIVSFVNITNVQAEDGGLYECSATNDAGQLRHSAWLNVSGSPFIRPMPNVSAVAGQSLAVMCPVGGWPIEQITWFQNSSKLPLNHRQKLFPNGTLFISELNEVTDSGQYSCQAKSANSDALALNYVHISIKVPPVVEPFAFTKSLHRGQRYNIMCTVVRGDLPVSIRWFKDGRPIDAAASELLQGGAYNLPLQAGGSNEQAPGGQMATGGGGGQLSVWNANGLAIKHLDPYSSTLTFSSLQSHHRGLYTCEATNEAGRANQSSTLVIHVPPEWRIEPRDMSVTVGKTAIIDCQADAFPAARIEWRLSQDLFREPPSEFKPIISSLYMRVFENGSLIIYNTQRTDAGYYLCQASNGVPPGLSRVIKLTAHVAAHFKAKIRTELVRRGQAARLKCESIGDPPVEIDWLKDKMPLYAGDEPRYSLSRTTLQDGLVSELTIAETDRADSALFTCITRNQYGNDDTNIQLIVQGPPDPPTDIRIHEYEARSVKVSWMPGYSGNSPISKYIIVYSQVSPLKLTSASDSVSQALTSTQQQQQQQQPGQYVNVSVGANESSVILQGLTPLTEYQFYMIAQNSIGASRPPNEPIKFRTDDEAPSGPPLFVKAQATSSRSIKVKWRAPERRAHFGTVAGFYVGYKSQRSSSSSSQPDTFIYKTVEMSHETSATSNKSSLEQECLLQSLRRGQKYLITVQAFNGRGAGPASEPIVIETLRIDVPDPPSLRLVQRTTHSIHLAWRQASVASLSGELPSNLALSSRPKPQQLMMRKNFNERIKAGQQRSQLIAGTTTESFDLMDLEIEKTARIDQDNDLFDQAQASEPILGYILTMKQIQNAPSSEVSSDSGGSPSSVEMRLPSDHHSQIVDNLTCGTKYQFTILALNSVGASNPSEPLIVKTEGSTPVAPDKSSLLTMNSSSVLINLAAWHHGSCAMRSFEILFRTSRSKKWNPLTIVQVPQTQTSSPSTSSPAIESRLSLGAKQQQLESTSNSSMLYDEFMNSTTSSQLVQRSTSYSQKQANQLNNSSSIVLNDLSKWLNYDLKIIATNEAGSTEALYTFNTNGGPLSLNRDDDQQWASMGGELQFSDTSLNEFLMGSYPMLTWLILLLFVALALSTGCILLARRRRASSSSCSLSLSSASRSNQSATNHYYASSVAGPTLARSDLDAGSRIDEDKQQQSSTYRRACQAAINNQSARNTLQRLQMNHHHHDGSLHGDSNILQLGDIYAQRKAAPIHLSLTDKTTNYAHLSGQDQRVASPPNTDITSIINGSEGEMCLGASALNISLQAQDSNEGQQQQQQRLDNNKPTNEIYSSHHFNPNLRQQQQIQPGYYMAPMPAANTTAAKSPNYQLSKSSTLPAPHCNQQLVQLIQQQIQQQQQQAHNNTSQQQQILDSLVTSSILQQQRAGPCNAIDAETYLASVQANGSGQEATNNAEFNMAAIIEHQLQQQVYATVKRGCPRPPRACDYTIYQCSPGQEQQALQQETQGQSGCCENDLQTTGCAMDQQHILCRTNEQQICLQQQQQQQQSSDYQQLRPIS